MAAKKKSGKMRGNDGMGNPLDTNKPMDYKKVLLDARTTVVGSREYKQAMRNMADFTKNPINKGRIALGPVKDPMSGRTVEAGTRSMVEGQRNFMRGGGGLNTRGK